MVVLFIAYGKTVILPNNQSVDIFYWSVYHIDHFDSIIYRK